MRRLNIPKGKFCEEKTAPWRREGLDRGILKKMAAQEPLSADIIKEHYIQANRLFVERVNRHEQEKGRLPDPKPGEYMMAIKRCTDARQATESLEVFFEVPVIHEHTAGSIVRGGHVFQVLAPEGFGIVEGHYSCGAANVAHQLHADKFHGEHDENVIRILNSIPAAVAAPEDPSVRDRRNAVHQAAMAKYTLEDSNMKQPVYPTFFTWEHGVDYQWLNGMPNSWVPSMLENEVRKMIDYALAEGREFNPQYSTMAVMYDPYRLGRYNDPRITMDALMNEFFSITFDFRRVLNGERKPLSRTGMGSLMYSNFHDGKGHVKGVGGENGTRIVGIVDPSEGVLERVKDELLQTPQVREMTRNGETILTIKYDIDTRLIKFVD